MDRDPLREAHQPSEQLERQRFAEATLPLLSPSDFSLVLRPDIGSDEHLLPIHESPWTPDGKVWFQAKISLLQDDASSAIAAAGGAAAGGLGAPRHEEHRRGGSAEKTVSDQELGGGGGLSVTLRPEGAGQRRARLEREAAAAMALEDERSRRVGEGVSRLEKEAASRSGADRESRRAASLAAAVFTAKVGERLKSAALEVHPNSQSFRIARRPCPHSQGRRRRLSEESICLLHLWTVVCRTLIGPWPNHCAFKLQDQRDELIPFRLT